MFRWLLIMSVLCPCPCQWVSAGTANESAVVVTHRCCGPCDAHHQHSQPDPEPDGPRDECPHCSATASIPPSRVSWDPLLDGGIWGFPPQLLTLESQDSLRLQREEFSACCRASREGLSPGRGMALRV